MRRPLLLVLLFLAAAAVVLFLGLIFGAKPMSLDQAMQAILSPNQGKDGIIVWTLRLPRSIAAWSAGAALAVAGYLLQSITRNPLAAPDLTGVSSGAIAAIVTTFVAFPSVSTFFYPPIGMAGGLAAAGVTLWAARGSQATPLHLALGGITVALFLNAVTAYALVRSGPQSPSVLFWLSGGFQGRSWPQILFMLPWIVVGLVGALVSHRVIALLALGDDAAAGMGVDTRAWRLLLLLCAVALVAGVTPTAGAIAFIGLATPHLVRLMRPREPVLTVLLNVSLGGLLLMTADALARSAAAPREVPVSIVTALIGGPIFIYLTQRRATFMSDAGRN